MPFGSAPLNGEVFKRLDWQGVVEGCTKKTCQSNSTRFFSTAKEAAEAGDVEAREAFAVLGSITSIALKADSREEPFTPLVVFNTGRSAILEDFSTDDLDVLREIVAEVPDPELQARIADVVWCKKRDYRMAQQALTSYFESARNVRVAGDWLTELSRTERAFALTAELGRPDERYSEVVEYTEAAVQDYENVRFDRPAGHDG